MPLFKQLLSILLLSTFLLPQVEKVCHNHSNEHSPISIKGTQILHKLVEKCAICDFEFSVFDIFEIGYNFSRSVKTYFQYVEFHSAYITQVLLFFSERGPPFL